MQRIHSHAAEIVDFEDGRNGQLMLHQAGYLDSAWGCRGGHKEHPSDPQLSPQDIDLGVAHHLCSFIPKEQKACNTLKG
ncbi:MAG: hypothetical protein AB8A32_08980 [Prochlorococcus sp.]